jgi:ribose-phosphate pyrophosphokinase
MAHDPIGLFSLHSGRDYGDRVARQLGLPLGAHEERNFEDGEHKIRSLENVRGRDVYVIQSLHGDAEQSVNEKLCRLLFFIGALNDASAAGVTAVIPYLCYGRKDRKTKPRDPVTTRYLAGLFEAVGTGRVVTLDVHNIAAFQNAFRCRTDHLEATRMFAEHFASVAGGGDPVVISPDIGGIKRAERFREVLSRLLDREIPTAFMEKKRSSGVVSGETIAGDVEGRTGIIIDDLISTGTTLRRAAGAARRKGARAVYAAASHGLFVDGAKDLLADPAIEKIVVTDSIPPFRTDPKVARDKLVVLDSTPLVATAIRRLHDGGSLVELIEG